MKPRGVAVLAGAALIALGGTVIATNDTDRTVIARGVLPDTVLLNACSADDVGFTHAAGSVTNPTDARSDYTVTVTVRDTDGLLLGTQTVAVFDVAPGKAAGWETATTVVWADDVYCEVSVHATARYSVP